MAKTKQPNRPSSKTSSTQSCAKQKVSNDSPASNSSQQSCATQEKYEVTEEGVFLHSQNPASRRPIIHISNFDLHVVGLRRKHQRNGTEYKEIIYTVTRHEDEPKHISHDSFGSKLLTDIIKNFPDCCLISDSGSSPALFKEFAAWRYAEAIRNIVPEDIYNYHGWERINGRMTYLSSARTDCDCDCYIPHVPREDIPKVWKHGTSILKIGKEILDENGKMNILESWKVSLPLFLYLHLGYACKLFLDAGISVQFLLVITGMTGSLKTSTCKALAQPFQAKGMLRMESTPRALELYREKCIDQTMVADDIFSQDTRIKAKFEEILRPFGDEIGRARSTGVNFTEIDRTEVRGGCIVTAENLLGLQQSSQLRYVTLELEPDSIDSCALSHFQENNRTSTRGKSPSVVQSYFAAWIHHLEDNYDEIVSFLEEFEPEELSLRFKRQERIYKIFAATAKLILNWGLQVGAITEKNMDRAYTSWMQIIIALMRRNENLAIDAEPWQQFIKVLYECISNNDIHLAQNIREYKKYENNFMGFCEEKNGQLLYVLKADDTFGHIQKLLQSSRKSQSINATNIYRELYHRGISHGYSNQADGDKVRVRYTQRRIIKKALVIIASALENAIVEI